ncbi:alpha-ketoglutarate-dependent dioxygenase AlkB [Palleronia sp. LCG004]|uniref:alpha-ketoglutarate-dependent dioxygenase AlkB n=1 Tax=Palleronia sp. LCG004 TaxID=3079304 RepID=UPI0029435407|nr:alpha-ketoglutarate-dependent dioxygenase AlkB [Palleronia sp. LCG004]WOI55990.1 alpha-ketoglutarate-dependent dioxygenase AlkB [Palleronia sp. LCG004]
MKRELPGAETLDLGGVAIHRGFLGPEAQAAAVDALRQVAAAAPFLRPETSRGKKMSVRMTSAGQVGWISDRRGYRYDAAHPAGTEWPPIPDVFLDLWAEVAECKRPPDTCLVNFYGEGARMGLHQDRDEASTDFPVVSLSLGDDALFRVGGLERRDPTRSIWLGSGDVAVLGGAARMVYHGIDRIRFGSSNLLPEGGRINVTLRVATETCRHG